MDNIINYRVTVKKNRGHLNMNAGTSSTPPRVHSNKKSLPLSPDSPDSVASLVDTASSISDSEDDNRFVVDKETCRRIGRPYPIFPMPTLKDFLSFVFSSPDFWISLLKCILTVAACTYGCSYGALVGLDIASMFVNMEFIQNGHRRGNILVFPLLLGSFVVSLGRFRWNFELARVLFQPLFKQGPLYLLVKYVDRDCDDLSLLRQKAVQLNRPLVVETVMGNLLLINNFSEDGRKYDLSLNRLLEQYIIGRNRNASCLAINMLDLSCATCTVKHESIVLGSIPRTTKQGPHSVVELVILIEGSYGDGDKESFSLLSLRYEYCRKLLLRNLRQLQPPRGQFLEELLKIYPAEKIVHSLLSRSKSDWRSVFEGTVTLQHLRQSFPEIRIYQQRREGNWHLSKIWTTPGKPYMCVNHVGKIERCEPCWASVFRDDWCEYEIVY